MTSERSRKIYILTLTLWEGGGRGGQGSRGSLEKAGGGGVVGGWWCKGSEVRGYSHRHPHLMHC